jgi:uncharacterized protein (TIGR03000 family)
MRKGLLVLSLVGLTVLASAGTVQAQRFGYWGGRGYYPQSGYYNSYYGGRGFRPYYDTYYQGYGYNHSLDYYYPPGYVIDPAYDTPPMAVTPRVVQSFYPTVEAAPVATMTVVVPTANAQVWFGGTPTTQQGTERVFHSPALTPGKTFTYTIKARWMENGKAREGTRQVDVQAGKSFTVNFRESPVETAPAPDESRP